MPPDSRSQALAGLTVTSLGTLASRVLGMIRDMATVSLLGISGDGVMDALVVALRVPNLFRRLFGEGALTASYLPVLAGEMDRDHARGWKLATVTFVVLGALLAAIVLAGELVCAAIAWHWRVDADVVLLAGLSAVMLPYLWFICLAAQVSGTLQALNCFSLPALVPTLLNLCWLAAIWMVAPALAASHELTAYILAASVLVAGILQLAVQIPYLRRLGLVFDFDWQTSRTALASIARSMGPMVLGLAVTQINSLVDSLLAWGLTAPENGTAHFEMAGLVIAFPFRQGAAAAIYFGERLYQFPLGILGLAVATAIFPWLSRHAARGARQELGRDLSAGLRLVIFLGLPAGAGLWLLADPLATLFFQHGEVTTADTERVAAVISAYAAGVWAFCATPVAVRAYYAISNQQAPLHAALLAVAANVLMNAVLIWPLAEAGLALSTSLAAIFQLVVLVRGFGRVGIPLEWPRLVRTAWQTVASSLAMAAAGALALAVVPADGSLALNLVRVALPVAVSLATFLGVARLLGSAELVYLWTPRITDPQPVSSGSFLG